MIHYFVNDGGKIVEVDHAQDGCWVHLCPPFVSGEITAFAESQKIPLDFLADSIDIDERSRFEVEDDIRLIVINTPVENISLLEDNDAVFVTVPIGIILTPTIKVTITSASETILQQFVDGTVKGFRLLDDASFVLRIFDRNVLRFTSCLRQLNKRRNVIEKELYDSSKSRELKQLLSIEKSLVFFVNSLSTNELLKMKIKRSDLLKIRNSELLSDFFEDIIIDNSQALEMSNVYTNILSGTMDAYSSIISNNLNIVIQRLTFITIALTVPTLIASLFGMNVPVPWSKSVWAFPGIIGFSVLLSLLLLFYFQRKKLL